MFKLFLISLVLYSTIVFSQTQTEYKLKTHVTYLADDKLEGRATGSAGEKLAARYIISEFMQMGLLPKGGDKNYLEEFTVHAGKQLGDSNYLLINKKKTDLNLAFPFSMSANGKITAPVVDAGYGIVADTLHYNSYKNINVKNKIALIQMSSPESNNPHAELNAFADERDKIKSAYKNGAVGVIFYNTDSTYETPTATYTKHITEENIPVYYVDIKTASFLKKYKKSITLSVELNPVIKTGHNILGYFDNGAVNTIVIGAHYDHLGHGEIDGSLYRGAPAIHNGADDNASGVALMIELARKLKNSDLKNNNYLFIAFSGEEMGLLGSNAFVNSELMKNYSFNYMFNFDMVGRLDSINKVLLVNGVGTSQDWKELKTIDSVGLHIKTTESGIGPSDQTSFYLKDIPVLFFFTGPHADYHKPTDDADKINYSGMQSVLDYAYNIISSLNDNNKISFIKTVEDKNESVPDFKVTLGVVPDYAFDGKGMRIDGVTDGKPASKAGLMSGDIVVKLGDYDVVDMMSYMKALSKFSKGDKTEVAVQRNNEVKTFPIQF